MCSSLTRDVFKYVLNITSPSFFNTFGNQSPMAEKPFHVCILKHCTRREMARVLISSQRSKHRSFSENGHFSIFSILVSTMEAFSDLLW